MRKEIMKILSLPTRTASILNSFYKLSHKRQIQTSAPLHFLFPKVKHEQRYKKADSLSNKYELTYAVPFPRYLQGAKHTSSFAFLTMPFAFGGYIYQEIQESHLDGLVNQLVDIVNYNYSEFWFFATNYVLFAYGLRWVAVKFPLRIYRKEDEFVAIFEGLLPFTKTKMNFIKGEFSEHFTAFNPFRSSTYKLRNTQIVLFPHHFKRFAFLHEMLESNERHSGIDYKKLK